MSIFKIARRDGEILDALREGQLAFFVAIDEIASSVEADVAQFREDRERFLRALREAAAHEHAAVKSEGRAGRPRGAAGRASYSRS